MSRRRNSRTGLFNGYWTTMDGRKIRRIRREEYPALYDVWRRQAAIRLGVTVVGMAGAWHRVDCDLCGNRRLRATGPCAACCFPLAADNGDVA